MSFAQTIVLGALAGFTIFLGLPVGRLQLLGSKARVALAMFSVGVLAFIFVDVLSNGISIVDHALTAFKDHRATLAYVVWLVVLLGAGFADTRAETTEVVFDALSDSEILAYVASGEPMDKAGAYAIQGLASRFVSRINGSYSNVVGLPVHVVRELLLEL